MMRMPAALVLAVALDGGLAVQAPDFSGSWVVDAPAAPQGSPGTPAPPPRGDMGSGWGTPITIRQSASELIVEQPIFSRYDLQPPLRFVYKLDGSDSSNTTMAGHNTQTRVSRASWDGQALTIVTAYPGIDPGTGKPFTTTVTQRLSLSAPAQLLIETVRSGALGGRETSTRTLYKKSS